MKHAFLLIHLLFTTSLLANINPTSLIKKELEMKVALNESGYKKLHEYFIKECDGKEVRRDDYYFELFDHKQYLLKKTDPAIKLRLMWDGLDLKWQIQQTTTSWNDSFFSFKETLGNDVELSSMPELLETISHYHERLNALDPYSLILAQSIQNTLIEKNLLKKSESLCSLCKLPSDKPLLFFSSHMNKKNRVKINKKIDGYDFSILVGETKNYESTDFELEAELKDSSDINKSAEALKSWLIKKAELNLVTDISQTAAIDPSLMSEKKLKELLKN